VDEKNGQFLIWYETYPDRYRFFNEPGFYGAGKERELADTEQKIAMLKQWVDGNAEKKKQEQDQSLQLQQSQTTIQNLSAQILQFKESQKTLEGKVAAQEDEITSLGKQKTLVAPAPVPNTGAIGSADESPIAVVDDPAFYKHGEVIPPNPKPMAWFQSLR
jgi:hypothetical protein